jgi:hypothetical protein
MRTRYRYIHFNDDGHGFNQRPAYVCVSNNANERLARIYWSRYWKQWTVSFAPDLYFDEGCLRDVADFLHQLTAANLKTKGDNQ